MKEKICTKCKHVKALSEFGKNSRNEDFLQSTCRECLNVSKQERKSPTPIPDKNKNPQLTQFTNRMLMEELKARGYTGELSFVQKIKL